MERAPIPTFSWAQEGGGGVQKRPFAQPRNPSNNAANTATKVRDMAPIQATRMRVDEEQHKQDIQQSIRPLDVNQPSRGRPQSKPVAFGARQQKEKERLEGSRTSGPINLPTGSNLPDRTKTRSLGDRSQSRGPITTESRPRRQGHSEPAEEHGQRSQEEQAFHPTQQPAQHPAHHPVHHPAQPEKPISFSAVDYLRDPQVGKNPLPGGFGYKKGQPSHDARSRPPGHNHRTSQYEPSNFGHHSTEEPGFEGPPHTVSGRKAVDLSEMVNEDTREDPVNHLQAQTDIMDPDDIIDAPAEQEETFVEDQEQAYPKGFARFDNSQPWNMSQHAKGQYRFSQNHPSSDSYNDGIAPATGSDTFGYTPEHNARSDAHPRSGNTFQETSDASAAAGRAVSHFAPEAQDHPLPPVAHQLRHQDLQKPKSVDLREARKLTGERDDDEAVTAKFVEIQERNRKRLSELDAQSNHLQEELTSLRADRHSLQEERQALQAELRENENTIKSLKESKAESILNARDFVSRTVAKNQETEARLRDAFAADRVTMLETHERLLDELQDLSAERAESKAALSQQQTFIANARKSQELSRQLGEENSTLRTKLTSANSRLEDTEALLSDRSGELDILRTQHADLQKITLTNSTQILESIKVIENVVNQPDRQSSVDNLQRSMKRIQNLVEEQQRMKSNDTADEDHHRSMAEQCELKLDSYLSKMQGMGMGVDELREYVDEFESIWRTRVDTEREGRKKENESWALRMKVTQEEIQRSKNHHAAVEKEKTALELRINQAETRSQEKDRQIGNLEAQKVAISSAYKQDLATTQREASDTKKQLEGVRAEEQRLKDKIVGLTEESKVGARILGEKDTSLASLRGELKELRRQLDGANKQLGASEAELRVAKASSMKEPIPSEADDADKRLLEVEVERLKGAILVKEGKIAVLQRDSVERPEAQRKLLALQRDHSILTESHEARGREVLGLKATNEKLQMKIKEQETKIKEHDEQNDGRVDDHISLSEQNECLVADLAEARLTIQALEKEKRTIEQPHGWSTAKERYDANQSTPDEIVVINAVEQAVHSQTQAEMSRLRNELKQSQTRKDAAERSKEKYVKAYQEQVRANELLEQGVKDAKIDDTDSISSLSDIRDDEENPLLPNGKVPKSDDRQARDSRATTKKRKSRAEEEPSETPDSIDNDLSRLIVDKSKESEKEEIIQDEDSDYVEGQNRATRSNTKASATKAQATSSTKSRSKKKKM